MSCSVVVPAHNAGPFIGSALRSVLSQSVGVDEIIVVDDASTDETGAIASSHGARVLRNDCALGPGAARNIGVAVATSDWVAFLDADDEWHPDHVAATLDCPRDIGVSFGTLQMFGRIEHHVLLPYGAGVVSGMWERLLAVNEIPQSGVAVRRRLFVEAGGYRASEYPVCEDYDLWLRLAEQGSFFFSGLTACRKRIHERQISRLRRREMFEYAWRARQEALCRVCGGARISSSIERLLQDVIKADVDSVVWDGDFSYLPSMLGRFESLALFMREAGMHPDWDWRGGMSQTQVAMLYVKGMFNRLARFLNDDRT